MGVDSPYAVDNESKYQKAKSVLEMIRSGDKSKTLDNEINEVSDPGLRAFLELNRLSKGGSAK